MTYQKAKLALIGVLSLLFLLFNAYLLPNEVEELSKIAGYDIKVLDLRMSYSEYDVNKFLTDIGDEGRDIYLYTSEVLDTIYPFIYGSLFMLILFELSRMRNQFWRLSSLTPVLAVVFDLIENHGFRQMLYAYPDLASSQIEMNSIFTSLKWLFVSITIALVIILLIKKLS